MLSFKKVFFFIILSIIAAGLFVAGLAVLAVVSLAIFSFVLYIKIKNYFQKKQKSNQNKVIDAEYEIINDD